LLETFKEWTDAEVATVIGRAEQAWQSWRTTAFAERAALMKRAGQVLRDNADLYARTMALEMGKPVSEGRAEVNKCAACCDFYAEQAEAFLADEVIASDAAKSYVAHRPMG
jgi:succinate-semialdehyde dehydrogenase / glutarate-semialdehyde dehydrogenase